MKLATKERLPLLLTIFKQKRKHNTTLNTMKPATTKIIFSSDHLVLRKRGSDISVGLAGDTSDDLTTLPCVYASVGTRYEWITNTMCKTLQEDDRAPGGNRLSLMENSSSMRASLTRSGSMVFGSQRQIRGSLQKNH